MALLPALGVGAVCAVVVPWYTTGQDSRVLGGVLDGREFYLQAAGGYMIHWSWLVFISVTMAAWLLIRAGEQKG